MTILHLLTLTNKAVYSELVTPTQHKAGMSHCTRATITPETQKKLYDISTMFSQRRRRWADVVQMLYKCFVFAGTDFYHGYIKVSTSSATTSCSFIHTIMVIELLIFLIT